MISYRRLAMRVLGYPLRVPTNTPRPASHRVTALALTAAMVAGMAAPAYAGTCYIDNNGGDITVTKDAEGNVYVKRSNKTGYANELGEKDEDNNVIIKSGAGTDTTKNPDPGTGSSESGSTGGGSSGSNSSEGGTPTTSAAKSNLTALPSEDSESQDEDKVSPDGTNADPNGSDSSEGGEGNQTQSTEKDQTGDTADGKNTGAGSSAPESTGSGNGTSGSESGTTDSDGTSGNEENDPKPGGTPTPAEGTESTESNRSAPESQFTYTGASLNVADANDDEETRNESTTTLKTAADNFKTAAQNVIRIINKLVSNTAEDNTLNVTLDNVNIDVSSRQSTNAALSVEGVGDTKITLVGDNKLTSGNQCAGLEHNEKSDDGSSSVGTGKLTITSEKEDGKDTGSLTATGDSGAAGIGGAWSKGAGTIEIAGGNITAISPISQSGRNDNDGGAGIGSGDGSTGTTTINISGGTIVEAVGGTNGDGIGGSSSNRNNPTTVTISGGTIQKAQGGQGHGSYDGGSGIHSDGDLTISGNAHIVSATGGSGDSSNSRSDAGDGIRAGTLTISGEARIDNATGGTADSGSAGDGIYNYGKLTIKDNAKIGTVKGGDATASGKDGGYGIRNHGQFTMSGGTITNAVGGKATGRTGDGGDGIRGGSSNKIVEILGGTITKAKGGDGKASGGDGIRSDGELKIEGGTIGSLTTDDNGKQIPDPTTGALGGNAATGEQGGHGIYSKGQLFISGSADIINAKGGDGKTTGGSGIHSSGELNISPSASIKEATGGNADSGTGENSTGGSGIGGNSVNVAGGTINTTGGSGKSGGAGIDGDIVSIGNTDTPLNITATSPDADNAIRGRDGKKLDEIIHLAENGKLGLVKLVENGVTRLFHNGVYTKTALPDFSGSETHPLGEWVTTTKPTCTEPGKKQRSCTVKDCVVTETEELPALGHQWSGWTPVEGGSREYRICAVCNAVEYRDVSHNSGFIIPTNLRVLDSTQTDILQNAQLVRLNQINDVLYIDVALETASLQGVLSDLTGLRSENIETVVFSTERCTSTLSLSDVAALGAGDTPFTLSHSGSTATFTVGGADHSALLR